MNGLTFFSQGRIQFVLQLFLGLPTGRKAEKMRLLEIAYCILYIVYCILDIVYWILDIVYWILYILLSFLLLLNEIAITSGVIL